MTTRHRCVASNAGPVNSDALLRASDFAAALCLLAAAWKEIGGLSVGGSKCLDLTPFAPFQSRPFRASLYAWARNRLATSGRTHAGVRPRASASMGSGTMRRPCSTKATRSGEGIGMPTSTEAELSYT